jgi:hypothetical protein
VLATAFAVFLSLAGAARAALSPHSCGWIARISGDQLNVAFPDAAANYWVAAIPVATGGYAELTGSFPHARYMSFIDYTAATQAIDGLADVQIAPDAGSTNPFVAGADRTAPRRSYAVRIVLGSAPAAGRAANTVYTSNADGSKSSPPGLALVIYRVYEADRGLDVAGGVSLPQISLVTAAGQRTTVPDCPDLSLPDLGLTRLLASAGAGGASPLPTTGLGGRNPPTWVRYTNPVSGVVTALLNNELTGDSPYPALVQVTNLLPSGGLFENIHVAYVTSSYTPGFGPLLAFRARAPTTPPTFDGTATMGSGQLRYWSLCTNNAVTMFYDCVRDDQVPLDSSGYYTIVISTAANRPANATAACGIAWLPAGPLPQTVLILRNMLPAPDFANAVQHTTPGTERQTMGDYYPLGRYYATVADFERTGCHPSG